MRLLITSSAGVVTSSIIARTLGPNETGVYAYAVWIGALLLSAAHGGIPTAMTRFIAEATARGERKISRSLFRKLLSWQVAIAVLVCAAAACVLAVNHPARIALYFLAIVMVLPQSLQQASNGAMTGLQSYGKIAKVSFAGAMLNVLAVFTAVFLKGGVGGILLGMLLATTATASVSLLVVRRALARAGGSFDAEGDEGRTPECCHLLMPRVRRFSATVWYLVLLDLVVWDRSEVFFLKRYSQVSQIAVYSMAFMLVCKLWEGASSVSATLAPLAADAMGRVEAEGAELGSMFRSATKYIHMFLVPICIVCIGFSKPAVLLLYGRQFSSVVPVLQILLLVPVLMTLTEAGVAMIYALERQSFLAIVLTPTCLLNLLLAWVLVPRHGAIGAATASIIAEILETALVVWYAARISKAGMSGYSIIRTWICAALAAAPALLSGFYGGRAMVTLSLSLSGAAIFLCLMVFLRELGSNEFRMLKDAFSHFVARLRPA